MSDWDEIYSAYTDVELADAIDKLKKQADSSFTSQTEGGRGWTRSTSDVREKLAAATRQMKERNAGSIGQRISGQANFSGVNFYADEQQQ